MKKLPIEKVLEWAYREELSREVPDLGAVIAASAPGVAHACGPMAGWLENPSEAIDAPMNRWGVVGVKDLFGRGPHPDAVKVGQTVQALAGEVLNLPGVVSLEGRCKDLWVEAWQAAWQRMPARLEEMLVRWAVARPPLDFDLGDVREVPERYDNGKDKWFRLREREAISARGQKMGGVERVEVLVNVQREPGKRPRPDCYRKFRLEPSPVSALEDRLKYAAWRAAMDVLYYDLVGQLASIEVLPCAEPLEPWADEKGMVA